MWPFSKSSKNAVVGKPTAPNTDGPRIKGDDTRSLPRNLRVKLLKGEIRGVTEVGGRRKTRKGRKGKKSTRRR